MAPSKAKKISQLEEERLAVEGELKIIGENIAYTESMQLKFNDKIENLEDKKEKKCW